jgi:ketosteroid isomerase-like protein
MRAAGPHGSRVIDQGAAMNTSQIAKKYVDLCKANQNQTILETLFSPDVVSVEAAAPPGGAQEVRGVKAVAEKGKRWMESHEIHDARVEGPWPNGNRFVVRFGYDVTEKATGRRIKMEEAAVLTVENGKIVREEFFYPTEG